MLLYDQKYDQQQKYVYWSHIWVQILVLSYWSVLENRDKCLIYYWQTSVWQVISPQPEVQTELLRCFTSLFWPLLFELMMKIEDMLRKDVWNQDCKASDAKTLSDNIRRKIPCHAGELANREKVKKAGNVRLNSNV